MVCFSPVLQMVLESGEVTLRARAPEARARRVREETILKIRWWYYLVSGKLKRIRERVTNSWKHNKRSWACRRQSQAMRTKEGPQSRRRGCTLTLYQGIRGSTKTHWLSSGCRIPNLAHSSFFLCESGGRTRCLAGFSCPCADTKRLLIKSALADSLLIRVCGVTARAHRDRLAWSGFSPDPGRMGKRPATDGELEDEAGADITEKKGALDYCCSTLSTGPHWPRNRAP